MLYIRDMNANNQPVSDVYLCRERQDMVTRSGKSYIKLILGDKTGQIIAMVWDPQLKVQGSFANGDMLKVEAVTGSYQGTMQLNVNTVRKAADSEYDPKDYYRCAEKSPEEYLSQARAMIDTVKDAGLHKLLLRFYGEDSHYLEKLKIHPAAKSIHHDYYGGLLEHMVHVTQMALSFSSIYPMNTDLVITGGLLHDIGKLSELSPVPDNDYTDVGRLMGHISLGAMMINVESHRIPEMTNENRKLLEHIILSHHGKLEYGSPVLPMTMEALAVQSADLADSQMKQMEQMVEMDNNPSSQWTGYCRGLERFVRKPHDDANRTDRTGEEAQNSPAGGSFLSEVGKESQETELSAENQEQE